MGCRCLVLALNFFLAPVLLIIFAVRIYFLPCIGIYMGNLCCWICCKIWFCSDCVHQDKEFPPNEKSLGPYEADVGEVVWRRGSEFHDEKNESGHPFLFKDGIEPADIAQGALGDCWLLSAFACLAEHPGAIEAVFKNLEYTRTGKYKFRFWDAIAKKIVTIVIDDNIPCRKSTNRPCFSSPHGDELWVLLLEKAFAKFVGSYAGLEGGHIAWALEAMTGDKVYKYAVEADGMWNRLELKHDPTPDNKRKCSMWTTPGKFDKEHMYNLLKRLNDMGCVLGCGSKGKDETLTEGRDDKKAGIVPGHAYTIVHVYESFGFKLLKIRNPWGTFEWDGDWSDKSDMWSKHNGVKQSVSAFGGGNKDVDDGSFWMSWDDFVKYFDVIDVCVRSAGIYDLRLDSCESKGFCGPFLGCCSGCLYYWLLCQGPAKMCCTRDGRKDNISDIENPIKT
uniref:Calpain catalytic domain-containing protein n=1 Tax=Octactis speculum TaxID=3111310 RepID=A0A7S2DAF3_9STRA